MVPRHFIDIPPRRDTATHVRCTPLGVLGIGLLGARIIGTKKGGLITCKPIQNENCQHHVIEVGV
jgi:hypothetical protein